MGVVGYEEAYALQQRIWAEKTAGREDDVLLLLEHPPTLTLGKSGKIEHLLVESEVLTREGLSLHFTDRGGDITYHGPGQLVAYPILNLRNQARNVLGYVYGLEDAVIRTLVDFSIEGKRDVDHVGVWVREDKICALGVRISKRITMHGLALNVNPNLNHFSFIRPCGISGRGITSMARLLGKAPPMEDVKSRFLDHFSRVFSREMEKGSEDPLLRLP